MSPDSDFFQTQSSVLCLNIHDYHGIFPIIIVSNIIVCKYFMLYYAQKNKLT